MTCSINEAKNVSVKCCFLSLEIQNLKSWYPGWRTYRTWPRRNVKYNVCVAFLIFESILHKNMRTAIWFSKMPQPLISRSLLTAQSSLNVNLNNQNLINIQFVDYFLIYFNNLTRNLIKFANFLTKLSQSNFLIICQTNLTIFNSKS